MLQRFSHALLAFEEACSEHGHQTLITIESTLERLQSLAGVFEESSAGSDGFSRPGGARSDAQGIFLVESTHPRGRQCSEVHAVFEGSIETVVIEIHGDDITSGGFSTTGSE